MGYGKTHLALAIVDYRFDNYPGMGSLGRFTTAPALLADIKRGFQDDSADSRLGAYQQVGLLVVDDLGAEYHKRPTDSAYGWADEQLHLILDHRYLQNKETVFTTNCPEDRIDPRLADRLQDKRKVHGFTANLPSYRSGQERRIGKQGGDYA